MTKKTESQIDGDEDGLSDDEEQEIVDEMDEEDEDEGTLEASPRRVRLRPFARLMRFVAYTKDRTDKWLEKASTWDQPDLYASMVRFEDHLRGLLKKLGRLNEEGWQPPKAVGAGVGQVKVSEGATVSIRDKKRSSYSDVLSKAAMSALKVTAVFERRVKVQTPNGEVLIIPRQHVKAAEEA